MDVHSPSVRSYNMSRIRSRDTKPERVVRKFLRQSGYRLSTNVASLPGKPDIVLRRERTVVFVHGCFWHGHEGCRYFVVPKTRRAWWLTKLARNRDNDQRNARVLRRQGWSVLTVFECGLRPPHHEQALRNLAKRIQRHAHSRH